LKIVKSPYLSKKTSDIDAILYTTSNIEPDDHQLTKKLKFLNFKMADGRHLENRFLALTREP